MVEHSELCGGGRCLEGHSGAGGAAGECGAGQSAAAEKLLVRML